MPVGNYPHGTAGDIRRAQDVMDMVNRGLSFAEIADATGYSSPAGARRAVQRLHRNGLFDVRGLTRQFGVEIECFGISQREAAAAITAAGVSASVEGYNHSTRDYWKVITDASVSGSGLEIVSPILKGAEGLRDLMTVMDALTSAGASVNRTCGMHVHLDMNNETLDSIVRFAGFYADRQDALDLIVAPSRRGNRNQYCRPITPNQVADARQSLEGRGGDRFRKFNLMSYTQYGTVEVRHHQGTVSSVKATAWVRLLLAMAEFATRTTFDAPTSLAGTLEHLVRTKTLDESTRTYLIARARQFGFEDDLIGSADDAIASAAEPPAPTCTCPACTYATSR